METCVFSKHFQSMDADQLGRTLKDFGVDGVDLTTRRGGHVEPERVKGDLPAFQQALAAHDIKVSMLTTSVTGADEPHATDVIETAGQLGIPYIKLGYWRYREFGTYRQKAAEVEAGLKSLEPVLKQHGVKAGFHTHSGPCMGLNANFVMRLIEDRDPDTIGLYYDAGHCTVEGAELGWMMGLDLAADRLFMVAVKDLAFFYMGGPTAPRKGWRLQMVPLDAGLTDWPAFIKCLKAMDFQGPISFHSEYQGSFSYMDMNEEQVVEQTHKDLAYWRSLWNE